MKRIFYILLLSAFAISSCNNDSVVDVASKKMEFNVVIQNLKRGSIAETRATTLDAGSFDKFKMVAMKGNQVYIPNTKAAVRRVENNISKWAFPDTLFFWPQDNSELKFYAYAPDSTRVSADNPGNFDFSVKSEAAEQADLVVAYNKSSQSASPLSLYFKHALSQIIVKARNLSKDYTVEVMGVKIVNLKSKGRFEYPQNPTEDNAELPSGSWSNLSDTHSCRAIGTSVTLDGTFKDITGGHGSFLVLPQQVSGWSLQNNEGSYFAVALRITKNSDNTRVYPVARTGNTTMYGLAAIPIPDKMWKPGYKYIYQISYFKGDYGVGVYPPVTEDKDPGIDNEPGKNPDDSQRYNPGDPILGKSIFFTNIEVDEYMIGDNINIPMTD